MTMRLALKPSDLYYRYPRDTVHRDLPKFTGKPDPHPFNRDDLYDVLTMLEAVMTELESADGWVLHMVEDILNHDLPRFVRAREEVFDFLVGCAREGLGGS